MTEDPATMTEDPATMTPVVHQHPPHHHPSLLAAIRDAILGDPHRDFTVGSIPRAITLLAIPMVLEMMMESLFAVVDVFWVAHLGSDAVATVGFTESLLTLLYAVAMGLSISAAATVARHCRGGVCGSTGPAPDGRSPYRPAEAAARQPPRRRRLGALPNRP